MRNKHLYNLLNFFLIFLIYLSGCTSNPFSPGQTGPGSKGDLTSDGNLKPYNRPNGQAAQGILSNTAPNTIVNNYNAPNISTGNNYSYPVNTGSRQYPNMPTSSSNPAGQTGGTSDIKERATLNGRVFGPGGTMLEGVKIKAKSTDPMISWVAEEQQTINGTYVIRNVPVGSRIEITATDGKDTKIRTEVLKSNLQGDPYANVFNFGSLNKSDEDAKLYTIGLTNVLGQLYSGENNLVSDPSTVIIESLDPATNWFKTVTTSNGYYNFEEVPAGINLQVTVRSKDKEKIREQVFRGSYNRLNFGGSATADHPFAIAALGTFQVADGVNPFINTGKEHNSTFSVDVDTASYTLMRNSVLNAGSLPGKDSVRIEEYLNYFDYNYSKPQIGKFSVNTGLTPSPFSKESKKLLRIGIQGKEIKTSNRKDAVLTFVVDTSGSMSSRGKLDLVIDSLKILVKSLRPTDKIGIVSYSNEARVVLEHTPVAQENKINEAIDNLRIEGSTNIEAGLREGYQLAQKSYNPNGLNRVILCSDGVSNTGVTDPQEIFKMIKKETEIGVSLSAIGFGFDNYNDEMLEKLAVGGDGYYAYVDNLKEATRIFVENATDTLQVIGKDVKIQVEFNKEAVKEFRLLGYENRLLSAADFRNDKVDAGEIGPNHSVTALYELEMQNNSPKGAPVSEYRNDLTDKIADVSIRFKDVDAAETPVEMSKPVYLHEMDKDFNQSPASFRLAAAVALYAEILRQSYWAENNHLEDVLARLNNLDKNVKDNPKVKEFIQIVEKAISLKI
jgi:Ca-activated chloride channel family protein